MARKKRNPVENFKGNTLEGRPERAREVALKGLAVRWAPENRERQNKLMRARRAGYQRRMETWERWWHKVIRSDAVLLDPDHPARLLGLTLDPMKFLKVLEENYGLTTIEQRSHRSAARQIKRLQRRAEEQFSEKSMEEWTQDEFETYLATGEVPRRGT